MDTTNDQNQQPQQPTQPVTPVVETPATPPAEIPSPPVEVHHNELTTEQLPADATPLPIPVETAAPAIANTPTVTPAPEATPEQGTTPPAPVAAQGGTDQPAKKPVVMIAGVLIAVIAIAGGAFFVMGRTNQTKRLGAYIKKTTPAIVQPTASPMPEEQELNTLDTGNPEDGFSDLNTELNGIQ
jgi:hypothetical protein